MQPRVRVLIADDHCIFREGLRKLLEVERDIQVVGEAADGGEAVRMVSELHPDMLLLDLAMPGVSGFQVLRQLRDEPGATRTLLLTASVNRVDLVTALQLGARGVVLKDSASAVLLKGIRGVMAGQYWVGRESVDDLMRAMRQPHPGGGRPKHHNFGLTEREMEVVTLILAADSNKEIARKLSVSEKTVKHHLTNIFDKLGVYTRLELALFALHHDELKLPDLERST